MVMTSIAEFSMLLWLLGFWGMLALFLGWDRPPGEQGPAMSEGTAGEQPAERLAQLRDLGYDTVLPGLVGRVVLPEGPGRSRIVSLKQVTVSDLFGAFQYLSESREQWPFTSELGSYAAYAALEAPGWELTVYFGGEATAKVEYYARKVSGGAPVSGVAGWEVLAQALVLSPDYEAVVGYLTLGPYWTAYYVV